MESARYGRTRYLVVVSCPRKSVPRKSTQSQQQQQLINAQNLINSKGISSNSSILTRSGNNSEQQLQPQHQNSHSGSTPSPNRKSAVLLDQSAANANAPATILSATLKGSSKHLIIEKDLTNLSRLSTSPKHDEKYLQQHAMQQTTLSQQIEQQSDEMNPNQINEVEESCLLGIDCNEKTTVGLVLRILGDTTIRLDGDG